MLPTRFRSTLIVGSLSLLLLVAGCSAILGHQPEVVNQRCGNFGGVGGRQVTVENPANETMTVDIVVEAIGSDEKMVASQRETTTIEPESKKRVFVGVSNFGANITRYEVSASRAD